MINLEKVTFGYRKNRLLFSDLNLEMKPGHVYGLLGKNGAGKTTLLKIMSGLLFAKDGSIRTLGFNPANRSAEMLHDIYFLPEELYIPALTVENFVKVYAPFYPNFNPEQFENYLKQFEIESPEEKLQRMSYGQKKKVLISFGLATNTKVFLLDEPTNGLDIPSKTVFRKLMASAVDESRLVVISTHQVRDLHSLIDTVVILDNGTIFLNHSVEEITHKLVFKIAEQHADNESVLYTEDNVRGSLIVAENKQNEESKLDLELLFNATIANKNKVKALFNL